MRRTARLLAWPIIALVEGVEWALQYVPADRRIRVFTDNTNVESWWRRGVGPHFDHCTLLRRLAPFRARIDLLRVGSKENLADKPSRAG